MSKVQISGLSDARTLANGVGVPCVGFGTWRSKPELVGRAVREAISAGYRHIDCAAVYGNEKEVGQGIAESGISRSDVFVTGKLWNTERGYENVRKAFEKTLDDLGLDYLDLYLIHWPANEKMYGGSATQVNLDTWQAMTELYQEGAVRAIGVSNFLPHHLEPLMATEVAPMVDQVQFHPGCMQEDVVGYCGDRGILVEAWSPLGNGKLLGNQSVREVSERVSRTPAQTLVRWSLQHGAVPLPKSVTPERIRENAETFDFELSAQDMATLDGVPAVEHMHPDEVDF